LEELTSKQRVFLRGLGQKIKPTISVGKMGVSDNTILSVGNGFNTKELLKVKIQDGCEETKEKVAEKISEGVNAVLVQVIGNTLLFYKRDRRNPKIDLP